MAGRKYGISVIMPACNEERGIENAIVRTMRTFEYLELDFEMIVVDDGSSDKTREISDAMAQRYPRVDVLYHDENLGSGAAFKTGIARATKDFVVFVPIDNPLEVEDMEAYLPRLDVCDIVVGFRLERAGYSVFARFASFVYNRILVPLLFNIGINDVNWISMYRRSLFEDGTIAFNSTSLFWLVEILIRARRNRLIVAEVPAIMKKRIYGRATCSRPSVMFKVFVEMMRYFWMIRYEDKRE